MSPLSRLRLLCWPLLLGLVLLAAVGDGRLTAQDKSKAPPVKEEEDPKAKGKLKPVPRLDDDPPAKPDPAAAEGPGVQPARDTLVVAVRSLPELMSPAFARSDSERFALDLLFEGLLRPVADSAAGRTFEPALARELPLIVPRGREFTLTEATWADPDHPEANEPVTAPDVRATVEKLRARAGKPGAEVGELIEAVVTDVPRGFRVVFKQGHPDPLSLLTFKILPSARTDDEAFARKPVGSGPFLYDGRRIEGGRHYAVFRANPAYGRRPSRTNLPRIREVRLLASRNPVADFRNGLVHLALTPHTGELATLRPGAKPDEDAPRSAGRLEVILPGGNRVDRLLSRRVYFLAVNHFVPKLGGAGGQELRRLLAHGIQRDAILNSGYRAGFTDYHRPLTGPFPPETWPCDPLDQGRRPLDDPDLARSPAARLAAPVELDLKYPNDDLAVERACQMMKEQLAEFKVTLTLTSLPPAELRHKVESDTDFQLAYWHYDYPDEWFSLAGLLDPRAQGLGNRNFMRYRPPAEFDTHLARCQNLREFGELRRTMQRLHTAFRTELPFIPLWHLDTHVLIHASLSIHPSAALLDPLAPFTHVDQWSFSR